MRLKIFDMVRLKLAELDPRVERRDRGIGAGSFSTDGVAGVGVAGIGVDLEKSVWAEGVLDLVAVVSAPVAVAAAVFNSRCGFVSGTLSGPTVEKVAGFCSTESESCAARISGCSGWFATAPKS